MSERTQASFNDDFWDIACGLAADDEIVVSTIEWLVKNDIDNERLRQDYLDNLERHVVFTYGLPPEMSDVVFYRCEQNIRKKELQHGEA